jgi:hypothetical protein
MIYVYGSDKFITMVWRACGRVAFLNNVSDASKLPRGAVLYVESLKKAIKAKLRAPWLTVRTAVVEVEDVKLVYVDAYYMLRGVEICGTCHVYVPDDALRQALRQVAGSTPIEFVESCRPTYLCASYRLSGPDPDEREAFLDAARLSYRAGAGVSSRAAAYVEPYIYHRLIRHYIIPTSITTWEMPRLRWTTNECTTVGTPIFDVDWDYYIDPPPTTPEKLAELLRRRKLFFQKPLPKLKLLKSLCPKTDPLRTLPALHKRA